MKKRQTSFRKAGIQWAVISDGTASECSGQETQHYSRTRKRQVSYSWEGYSMREQSQAAVIIVLILSAHPANISSHIQRNTEALPCHSHSHESEALGP